MEENTTNLTVTPEQPVVRDYETLLKVGPKKMNNEELCFMVNKLKKEKDMLDQQCTAYKDSADKAFERARNAEEELQRITSGLNLKFDYIMRTAELLRDSIELAIKGGK